MTDEIRKSVEEFVENFGSLEYANIEKLIKLNKIQIINKKTCRVKYLVNELWNKLPFENKEEQDRIEELGDSLRSLRNGLDQWYKETLLQ